MRVISSCLISLLLIGLAASPAAAGERAGSTRAVSINAADPDTAKPVIRAFSLKDGSFMPATGRSVFVEAADENGIERIDFLFDGRVVATQHTMPQWVQLNPPAGYNGPLLITAKAYDHAGNVAERAVTVQVDTDVPTGSFVTPAEDNLLVNGTVDVVVATSGEVDSVVSGQFQKLTRTPGTDRWTGTVKTSGEISVVISDQAGNRTTIVRKLRVDAKAPSHIAIEPLSRTVVNSTFTTTVHAVNDDNGPVTGELWVNGRLHGTRTAAPYTFTVTAPHGPVELRWRLTDAVGNAAEMTRSLDVDTEGPVATTFGPAQRALVRGTFTATLSGITDATGFVRTELLANGVHHDSGMSTPYPMSFRVDTRSHSGYVNLTWKLTDRFGNTRTYQRQVIADNKAPTVSITKAPKHKAKVKGTTKVYVKASDYSGIARVELIVNGKVVARDVTSAYLLSFNASKQKKTMKVQVRAYDKLGNVKYTTTRTWYRK